MKHLNLILNIVLLLGLALLYIFHFSSGKKDSVTSTVTEMKKTGDSTAELPIAFLNIDTLLSKMIMYTDLQDELGKKQQNLEANFASKYKTFEQSVTQFQNEVSKGLLTRSEMQTKDQQLAGERQKLENLQSEYLNQMQEEGMVGHRKVINYIMEYLKEYNQDNKFQYIFSFSFGSNLLYADEGNDITSEILTGLNNKYKLEKVKK